jgi:restriction endonuclease Mrr
MPRGETWNRAILSAMIDGSATTNEEIYQAVEDNWVDDPMLEVTRWGNRPRYQHTVRSTLTNVTRAGLARRMSRGVYRITDAGLRELGV